MGWISEGIWILVSEVFKRLLSSLDEFGNDDLVVDISIEISLSVLKLSELI